MSDMDKRMDVSEGSMRWKIFLHLIGKAGSGKSATGNTLLGSKLFKVSSSTTSTIGSIDMMEKVLGDWVFYVVDGPGLIGVDATGFIQDHWDMYKKVCEDNADCGHVFLIVCRYGAQFTAEDSSMVDALRNDFAGDVFRNHGIVVVTCGDNFKADFEDEESTTFESWCRGQGGDFGQLVAACGQRVLLVDNSARSTDPGHLLEKIQEVLPDIQGGYEPLFAVVRNTKPCPEANKQVPSNISSSSKMHHLESGKEMDKPTRPNQSTASSPTQMAEGDNRWKTFLHLIGKTGTGKSATGNSLLGDKVFKVSSSSTSTIEGIHSKERVAGELTLEVVDGPGLIGVDATGFNQDHCDMYKNVCEDNPDCGHVFLIVCRYGERFTAEDSSMVDALRNDLGDDVFWNHGVVVVTCGDNFKADFEDEKGTKFESWCRGQGGGFGQLVAACGQRVLLVDNSAGSADRFTLHTKMIDVMPGIMSSLTRMNIAAVKNKTAKPARGGLSAAKDKAARAKDSILSTAHGVKKIFKKKIQPKMNEIV